MDGKINCVVVDDDKMMLKIIASLITKTEQLNLLGSYDNAVIAINVLEQQQIDLVFLDIEMPEMSGLEFIKALSYHPQIILISNKKHYALDAFEYDVADYLLKPIASYSRFLQAVGRAKSNLQKHDSSSARSKKHIYLKVDSLLVKFDLEDIHWIEAFGDYIRVKTSDTISTVYATLKSVEDALPQEDFVRIHRSYIVRVDKIENIDLSNLQIRDKILPISQSYKKKLMGMINSL